jgi:hypothetical protein
VTALLERTPVAAPDAAPRRARGLAALLPWLIAGAALAAALRWTDTPTRDITAYAIYWLVGIVLPGTLAHRALRGSRGNLPEDLGYGAATGLLLELIAWALAAAVGAQPLLRWWPAVVIVLFLAVPALRRNWRIASPRPLPVLWSWLVAAVVLAVIGWAAFTFRGVPLPPADSGYYQDLMYHLALVQELTRSMPFEVPQLAGDTLRYHYLSDAHMAAASMITGASPATVLLRLWIVPIAATAALVVAALTREITGRWWAGPLAAGAAIVGLPLTLGAPIGPFVSGAIVLVSPSQTYALPLAVLLMAFAVDVLRGRPLRWAWCAVPVLALACAGAKSSALPPLLVGVLLAGVVAWWRGPAAQGSASGWRGLFRRRPVPWSVAWLAASIVVAMGIGFKIFAGGGAGTLALQPLSALTWMEPYQRTLGFRDGVAHTGFFPPGVANASAGAKVFIAGLIGWWLLMQAPRLLGLVKLTSRKPDPVAWLLGGATLAGLGAAWAFWHPSASQLYFFAGVVPLGVLLTVWLLADLVPDPAPGSVPDPVPGSVPDPVPGSARGSVPDPLPGSARGSVPDPLPGSAPGSLPDPVPGSARGSVPGSVLSDRGSVPVGPSDAGLAGHTEAASARYYWSFPVLGLVAGAVWVFVAPATAKPAQMKLVGWAWALALPVLRTAAVLAALLVVVAIAGFIMRRKMPWRVLAVVAVAAVLGSSIGTGLDRTVQGLRQTPNPRGSSGRLVTTDEMRAALWLDQHVPNDDVVATNVHCQPIKTKPACDARAFWVAGLGGHRTVVESWGYSDEAVQANGVDGRKYVFQPAPYPAEFALNEQAFSNPTPAVLAQLRSQYKVKWLFADTRAGTVSAQLTTLATVKFTSGPVTIYAF